MVDGAVEGLCNGLDPGSQGIPTDAVQWPLPNVYLGTSIEDQATAEERIPLLLRCPAAGRFLSCEPLLGYTIVSYSALLALRGVIVGGETGRGARPFDPTWARRSRRSCQLMGVPFFFKSQGGARKGPDHRLLDGRAWNELAWQNGSSDTTGAPA
jgi:protein gp37